MKIFSKSVILGVAAGFLLAGYAAFVAFDQPSSAEANVGNNVLGYAWSETVGWISFNCSDEGTCGSVDYGVNIREDRFLEGYAWSEHIGWLSFNLADTGDPPGKYDYSGNGFIAKFQSGTDGVRGWARGLAGADDPNDGWDGWIKLRNHPSDGGPDYAVTIDENTGEFHGWAWGGEVLGWVSFNCEEGGSSGENVCGQSQYHVVLDTSFFGGPQAAFSCNPADCTGFTSGGLVLNNDSTDPDGFQDIVESQWTGIPPELTCGQPSPLCNYTTQVVAAGTYTVQLRVQDKKGYFDTAQKDIVIKQDIVADFDCSLDGQNWQSCETLSVSQGEAVQFQNLSTPSDGAGITSYSWTFEDGNPPSSSAQNPTATFQGSGSKLVSLEVQDTAGRTDTKQVSLGVTVSFPQWQEISPF